jgi:CPA2 family monovalent cation:H+ antiporter-2
MAVLVVLTLLLLRRSFTRLYSKAQAALFETFAEPPAPLHTESSTVIPAMMREAKLQLVPLKEGAAASGKLIVELRLRSETGASIVGIERAGENIVNPPPDEELRPGDRVLLLGTRAQLDAAAKALTGSSA